MAAHSDLTFITNENGQNLLERFKVLIRDTEFFDVLVGYFYTSGFHALYQALGKNKQAFTFATTEEDVEFKAQRVTATVQYRYSKSSRERLSPIHRSTGSVSQTGYESP